MTIPIDRRSGRPVFRQIVDYLRRAIESGRLVPGAKLDPIRALASALGVNRETVADAYRELETLGLTESTVGRGTYVLPRAGARLPAGAAPERPFVPLIAPAAAAAMTRPEVDYSAPPTAIRMEGIPGCSALFPVEDFRKSLNHVMAREGRALLGYGDPQGHSELRRVLIDRLARAGIEAGLDDVLVTGGSTQALAIAARVLCEPGDTVAVEAPTYAGVPAVFEAAGLRLVSVPMTGRGLDLDALEALLVRGAVRCVYTMPSFQNPTGVSTTLEHRRRLLDLTMRHNVPVLEDDFEHELRVRGRPVPPLKALDRGGNVVYLSTFSKVLFPGVRIGWLVAGGRVTAAATALKRTLDLSSSPVLQAGLARFCRSGIYDQHVRRIRRELAARLAAAEKALAAELPPGSTFSRPDGGFVVWVTLPEALDTTTLLTAARAAGLVYAPGQIFFPDARRTSSLRLSLAQAGPDEIARGIRILGEVATAALPHKRTRAALPREHAIHV